MMRRVLAAILMLCALASCSRNPVEEHAFLMDTWCSITFYDRGDEELSDEAFAILEEIDARLDRFDSGSEEEKDRKIDQITRFFGFDAIGISHSAVSSYRFTVEKAIFLRSEQGYSVYSVGSGSWNFVSRL